jgi:hypothetical protein
MVFIFLVLPFTIKAQESTFKEKVDSMVSFIEKIKGHREAVSRKLGFYEFTFADSFIVKIKHSYKAGPKTIERQFYNMNKSWGLIYSTERESWYYESDSSVWAAKYFFRLGKLIDMVTIGHGKSETDDWNPEKEIYLAYYTALDIYTKHKLKKN